MSSDDESVAEDVPVYKRGIACIDGTFVPAETASVSIFDHSFLYGDGAFEGIVCRNGRLFAVQEHLDRLSASCQYLRIQLPFSQARLAELVVELVQRNGYTEGFVRIVVSRGEGSPVHDPRHAEKPTVVISMQKRLPISPAPDVGVKLMIASTRRTPPICLEPRVKSNNYLNLIVAKLEAIEAGCDDAILLDLDGNVAELPVANIFVRHGNVLSTPPVNGVLGGITRQTIFRLVREGAVSMPLEVTERVMAPYDLFTAEEMFVVGTGHGVTFVESVDGRLIGDGKAGKVTAELISAYDNLLETAP